MPQNEQSFFEKHRVAILLFLLVIAGLQGYLHRFVQDDAFISFHYARNLLEGKGLTWFGVHVEGYTNFLWVLLIAAGMRLNIEPVACSYLLGIAAFILATYCLHRLAYRLSESGAFSCWAALLFLTNFSIVSYATGGLETMLQTALIALMLLLAVEMAAEQSFSDKTLLALSLVAALALLTRLDSLIAVAVIFGGLLILLFRQKQAVRKCLLLVLPGAIMTGVWFAWKLSYYGDIFPNTFHAKIGGSFNPNGVLYIWRFLHWYLLWPFFAVGLIAALRLRRSVPRPMFFILPLLAFWCGYVIYAGGDFMEFRFLIPMAPALFLTLAWLIDAIGQWLRRRALIDAIAAMILFAASWHHQFTFTGVLPDMSLDSIPALSTSYWLYNEENWDWIGAPLGQAFQDSGAVIATTAAGAIPYYSRLRTVDMWGLNDPVLVREGEPVPPTFKRPGHRRYATLSYLKAHKINFLIGHPQLATPERLRDSAFLKKWAHVCIYFNAEPIGDATLLAFPVAPDLYLLMWYLTPTPELDWRIRANGWPLIFLRNI